jgi:hypothetical protein
MESGMATSQAHARVFVVQLGSDADPGHGHLVGRLEHVDSGRRGRFASVEEMTEFFARILRELETPEPIGETEDSTQNH